MYWSGKTGTAVTGELGPEGRKRGANKAVKYGRAEVGRSARAPINQYFLQLKQQISHHEGFCLRLSRFYSNWKRTKLRSWCEGRANRCSGKERLHFRSSPLWSLTDSRWSGDAFLPAGLCVWRFKTRILLSQSVFSNTTFVLWRCSHTCCTCSFYYYGISWNKPWGLCLFVGWLLLFRRFFFIL